MPTTDSAAADVARLRLSIHGLSTPRFTSPEAVVGWFGAMQSQEYSYAKWSIGQRCVGVDETAVDRALADGTVLRTHILRPTWHFVLAEDIRWMLAVTRARVLSATRSYDRELELDAEVYARCNDVIGQALEGGKHLTRTELGAALASAGVAASGRRLGHIVARAEFDAVICSGIPREKQNTYALVSERAPGAREMGPEEALAELTRRYFTSHGPATEKDFRWWSSLRAADARRGMEMLAGELEHWQAGDPSLWWVPQEAQLPARDAVELHLLQIYDESIVAYTESREVLDPAGLARGIGVAATFSHPVVMNGSMVTRWKRSARGTRVEVQIQPLRHFTAAERRALREEVARYGRFAGLPAEIVE